MAGLSCSICLYKWLKYFSKRLHHFTLPPAGWEFQFPHRPITLVTVTFNGSHCNRWFTVTCGFNLNFSNGWNSSSLSYVFSACVQWGFCLTLRPCLHCEDEPFPWMSVVSSLQIPDWLSYQDGSLCYFLPLVGFFSFILSGFWKTKFKTALE